MALADQYDFIYAAVGIHAHSAQTAANAKSASPDTVPLDDQVFAGLVSMTSDSSVVALGELGLDYHYDFSPRALQRRVLARQLEMARELDRPVILHNRESDADLMDVFDRAGQGLCGVLHCFMAGPEMAEWALARGLYIGIAGPITFKNVSHLVGIVRRVPLDRLLVETDSPYLTPHPYRGRRNEPAHVAFVVEKIASLLDLPAAQVAEQTYANACRLFGVT